ncbi:DNA-binding protein [Sporolactobacillus sp. Y61]|uniref:DNA-binding protein n=1 Tax=Sporolactobacillus sp. Y61 TaxID=3160863 RepID=A0AAU8IIB0_9BACL
MIKMPSAILDKTKEEIKHGIDHREADAVYEGLEGVFSTLILKFQHIFSNKILSINVDTQEMIDSFKNYRYTMQVQKLDMLIDWVNRFAISHPDVSDLEFGKLKIDLEFLFLEFGGKHIIFEYKEDYLLTPKETADQLNISRVTFNKYVRNGLETAHTAQHKKVPKFAVELWNNPAYSLKMQMIYQKKKSISQSPHDRLIEINEEIKKLQAKYSCEHFSEAFKGYNGDEMDDTTDYWHWRDLEEERSEILKETKEK